MPGAEDWKAKYGGLEVKSPTDLNKKEQIRKAPIMKKTSKPILITGASSGFGRLARLLNSKPRSRRDLRTFSPLSVETGKKPSLG
jgi:hypothetical protein